MAPTVSEALRVGRVIQACYDPLFLQSPETYAFADIKPDAIVYGTDPDQSRPYGVVYTDWQLGIVCALRGTQTVSEWMVDAEAPLVSVHWLPGTRAHEGFLNVAKTLDAGEIPLASYIANRSRTVLLAGHSLGAALASLVAVQLGAADLLTFGSPRVGDDDFVKGGASRLASDTRYVTDKDLVPTVPLRLDPFFPYAHLCQASVLHVDAATPDNPEGWHQIPTYLRLLQATQA
ncbi:MAG: lipase family protein [Patescibacteria group bacterium]|nr:lipase family protein [Patescibacteria group bacterium]